MFLLEHGEWVVEIDRPKRPAWRNGAKSDELDAIRAACEALSREHLAQPRQRGWREALRVLMATREGRRRFPHQGDRAAQGPARFGTGAAA
jgi:transposase